MNIQSPTLKSVLNYFEVSANCSGNNIVVKILDAHGRIAKTIIQTIEENIDQVRLNMDDLRKGKYIVNIFTDDNFIKAVRYIYSNKKPAFRKRVFC